MSLASMVNPRFDRIGNTVASTFSGIQANEVTGNARAKVLIGSYLIFSEAPLVGYGAFGALEKLEDLGVVRFAGSANQKTLPLHGSITSILLAGGLLSGFFYCMSFFMLFNKFLSFGRTSWPVSKGGISLLISGFIVQLGGDFFTQVFFILVLGYFLNICHQQRSRGVG